MVGPAPPTSGSDSPPYQADFAQQSYYSGVGVLCFGAASAIEWKPALWRMLVPKSGATSPAHKAGFARLPYDVADIPCLGLARCRVMGFGPSTHTLGSFRPMRGGGRLSPPYGRATLPRLVNCPRQGIEVCGGLHQPSPHLGGCAAPNCPQTKVLMMGTCTENLARIG